MAHAAQRIAPKSVPTEGAPKRPMPKAERRVQLLKIAYDMIDQDGIGALTMAGLAERSGAAKPVVYEHFSNSQEVIFCLLDDYFQSMSTYVLERNAEQDSIHAFFDVSIDAMFDFHRTEKFNLKRITNGFSIHEKTNTLFFEYNKRSVAFYKALLVQQGIEDEVAAIAASILHELILGTVNDFSAKRNHAAAKAVLKLAISGFLNTLATMDRTVVAPTDVLKLTR